MKHYDLAVIGSGSGLMIAEAALERGLSCALVEKDKFGGTCLTRGCIPSKMLAYPADMIREAQAARRIGLSYSPPAIDWERLSQRLWKQIGYSGDIARNLKSIESLDVYEGMGEFIGPRRLRVRDAAGAYGEPFEADRIVIAAGSRSFVPQAPGLEAAGYLTAETFFGDKYPKKPWESLIIVGGGAVGAEFAHIFSALGTKVTLIEMRERILPAEEEEISAFVEAQFRQNGIRLRTGAKLAAASRAGANKVVEVEDVKTGEKSRLAAEEIFISSGIRSNGDLLNLTAAGIRADARGWIEVDEFLQTSAEGVFAIGDINGKYPFRHKANYEASVLIENLFGDGPKKAVSYDAMPWAIFTWPQVGHAGLTEREARAKGLSVGIARNRYSEIAGGIAMGYSSHATDDGFAKIILTREMKIVGAHIVGPYASMLVQPFVYLMNAGACPEPRGPGGSEPEPARRTRAACPSIGSVRPVADSMVIHPSMNELAAWAIEDIDWSRPEDAAP